MSSAPSKDQLSSNLRKHVVKKKRMNKCFAVKKRSKGKINVII